VREIARAITLQVIVRAVFGVEEAGEREQVAATVRNMLDAYTRPLMLVPALRVGPGPGTRFRKARAAFDAAMRAQIEGYIAQGAMVMDPNAGRDIQNALSDMENAAKVAKQHGMKGHPLHDLQSKTDDLGSKINDDHAQGLVNDTTASTLSGELLNFSGAIGGSD